MSYKILGDKPKRVYIQVIELVDDVKSGKKVTKKKTQSCTVYGYDRFSAIDKIEKTFSTVRVKRKKR